jgi:hypothetical protein
MAEAHSIGFNNLLMFSQCTAICIIWTVYTPGKVCGSKSYVMLSAYMDFVCGSAKNYASCLPDLNFSTDIVDLTFSQR